MGEASPYVWHAHRRRPSARYQPSPSTYPQTIRYSKPLLLRPLAQGAIPTRHQLELIMTELPVILIADDDPDLRRLVRMYLESSEYTLIEANSGTDALEKILIECPDLVILDVMMPGMTGWEILRYMRTKSGYADIAVLMLTGIGAALNEMSSPMYGADDYLDKPFQEAELLTKVRRLLSSQRDNKKG